MTPSPQVAAISSHSWSSLQNSPAAHSSFLVHSGPCPGSSTHFLSALQTSPSAQSSSSVQRSPLPPGSTHWKSSLQTLSPGQSDALVHSLLSFLSTHCLFSSQICSPGQSLLTAHSFLSPGSSSPHALKASAATATPVMALSLAPFPHNPLICLPHASSMDVFRRGVPSRTVRVRRPFQPTSRASDFEIATTIRGIASYAALYINQR